MGTRRPETGRLLLLVGVALAIPTGCGLLGDRNDAGTAFVEFLNQTDGPITVTYAVPPAEVRSGEVVPDPLVIPAGGSDSFAPRPTDDGCLVAPVVVTAADGERLLEVPAGHCYGDVTGGDQSSFVVRE